jgi:hypothetical protein
MRRILGLFVLLLAALAGADPVTIRMMAGPGQGIPPRDLR